MGTSSEIRLAHVNRVDIAYRRSGSGAPVLLLHPVGLDSSCWEPFSAQLARHFCVLAPDLRGHGASAPIRAGVRLADFADDAAALLRSLGLAPAQVVGLSMGGMIAQELAIRHPDRVHSIALLATACTLLDATRADVAERGETARRGDMQAVLDSTLERWFTAPALASQFAEDFRRRLLENDAQSWAWCWRAISQLDTIAALHRIQVPALVVTGSVDLSAAPAAARQIAENIPHARLEIIDGAPHMGAFEFPATYLAPVLAFLRENAP